MAVYGACHADAQGFVTACPPSTDQLACLLQEIASNSAPAGNTAPGKWTAIAITPPTTTAGPFQQQIDLKIYDGATATFVPIAVPDNLHLVIESVSVYGSAPAGQIPVVALATTVSGSRATFFVPVAKQDSDSVNGLDWIMGSASMRFYCDPPSAYVLITRRQKAGDTAFTVAVSGYLVASQ